MMLGRNDDVIAHYGTPQNATGSRGSGRYRKGSGKNPYQHDPSRKKKVSVRQQKDILKKQGKTNSQIAKELGMSINEMNAKIKTEKAKEMSINVSQANKLRNKGYGNTDIARMMQEQGYTVNGKNKITESNIRYWLQDERKEKISKNEDTKEALRKLVAEKSYIDVGPGVETLFGEHGMSKSSFDGVLRQMELEGYELLDIRVNNPTDPSKFVHTKVLAKPGTEWSYLQNNQQEIKTIEDYSTDSKKIPKKLQYPASIDSDRIKIRYAEEGGKGMDGVILLRPGVEDLSLGNAHYAQVRIAVDGTHYLKGMAMYSDDIPKGYDIVFNTNKHVGVPKKEVLKELKTNAEGKIDKDLPFGSVIKADGQSYYEDPNGSYVKVDGVYKKARKGSYPDEKRYSLSAINKLKEEGEWNTYSKNLSSQFLSKQHQSLIKQQLDLTYADKLAEFDEIKKLSNPIVKRKLLESFAEDCDASAVHLKASPLPGQNSKVILPLTGIIADDKVYAPGYPNGSQVALIRHPHAGTFEIPVLTVDNNNRRAKKILGNTPIDCIGITSKVADKLSGADFDGDHVIVIPIRDKSKISSRKALKGLETFDPKEKYPYHEGMHVMTEYEKGIQMGKISNLITDMTLQGAPDSKVERAVKHSMVVIDAKKHKLDYQKSYKENDIASLEKEYQNTNGKIGGASTLISRAKSQATIDEIKTSFNYRESTVSSKTGKRISGIDPKTGEKIYETTDRYYYQTTIKTPKYNEKGELVVNDKGKPQYNTKTVSVYPDKNSDGYYYNQYNKGKKTKVLVSPDNVKAVKAQTNVTKMEKAKDARELSSGHAVEELYANYANKMKTMANDARLEFLNTPKPEVNKSAKEVYANEVKSLQDKLALASANAPKERAANRIANYEIANKKKEYYDNGTEWDKEDLKKAKQQALSRAREQVGANKKSVQIEITPKEWEAIQANALSSDTLQRILTNADEDAIRKLATPKQISTLSSAEVNKIKRMQKADFTTEEIAEALGRSVSTVSKYLKE